MSDLSQFADVQLRHSHWSTHRILEACAALPHESFIRPFEISEGSLHAVLSHVLAAMSFFADVFDEDKYAPSQVFNRVKPARFDERASTAAGQLELIDEIGPRQREAALSLLNRKGPGELVWWPNLEMRVPVGASIAQVVDHSSYHRAQCNNMIRHVGAEPVDANVHEWGYEHGLQREA